METWELAARESIRDLVARYNTNGDSGRLDAMLELFVEDARVEFVGHRSYRGRSEIRDLFSGAAGRAGEVPTLIQHHVSSHLIDFTSETLARGRAYFMVVTQAGVDHWGRYGDKYRLEDGRWLFSSRKITLVGQVSGGWGDRAVRRLAD